MCSLDSCAKCADAINGSVDPFCSAASESLFNTLNTCICSGACQLSCEDNVCVGLGASQFCSDCFADVVAGCGNEFNACNNDL